MRKLLCVAFVIALATVGVAQDEKNPVTETVKKLLERQSKNLVAAAEEMPPDKYGYKPTEQQMTFAHLVGHISGSNRFLCAKLSDAPESKEDAKEEVKDSDGKDKIVAALKSSFDYCSTALGKMDDSKLAQPVTLFGGRKANKAGAMIGLTNDWADHYSMAAMYLRLNGLLPPTAQKK
jgi:DinB family protein